MVSQSGVAGGALGQLFVKCLSNLVKCLSNACQILSNLPARRLGPPVKYVKYAVKPVKPVKLLSRACHAPAKVDIFRRSSSELCVTSKPNS